MNDLPLDGFAVAVTADRRAEEQIELLARHGARVVHGPVMRTLALSGEEGLRAATDQLLIRPPQVVIANTGIGMRGWLSAADSWGVGARLSDVLRSAEVVARGPKAAGALVTIGCEVAWRGRSGRLSEVVEHLLQRPLGGVRIALQRDGSSCTQAVDALRAAGAAVVVVPIYEWTRPEDEFPAARLVDAICAGTVDAVTFTSRPAIENLVAIANERGSGDSLRRALGERVLPVCVGPVCLDAARGHGFSGATAPERPLLGAMIAALAATLAARRRVLHLRTGDLVLQGATAIIEGRRVELTGRESDVLNVLADRLDSVVSKATLLRDVWGDASADPHALEMTVSRLRRRLGPAGASVQTVVRRGYRLALTAPR